MQTSVIQRQYDEVIAPHYDLDPHSVIGNSLRRTLKHIRREQLLGPAATSIRVLDVGMGTGRFLAKLIRYADRPIETCGLDLSARMIDVARERLPGLVAEVDDAANLDLCFQDQTFDLIATHFITGFVPIDLLAPKIYDKLAPGGYWSFIGGTKAGFPELRKRAEARKLKWLFRENKLDIDGFVSNPAGRKEVVDAMERHGFVIRHCETFKPNLHFANFQAFLEFAYWGGWLTPFVEALGLHKARPMVRLLLNALAFPVKDHHCIEIVLAQRSAGDYKE
jgi:SAM-dependent methyltransferase